MGLHLESLDSLDTPLTQQFWMGFSGGLGIVYVLLFVVRVLLRKAV